MDHDDLKVIPNDNKKKVASEKNYKNFNNGIIII